MPELKSLKEILKEEMRSKNMTVAKIAEATGIAPMYVQALVDSNLDQLPAAPYVRGYLEKIAEVLGIDFTVVWRYYAKETDMKRSGDRDELPGNRFAARPIRKALTLWILVGVIALIILVPVITNFLGKPTLDIIQPSQNTTIVASSEYTIQGKLENPNDRVFINGTELSVTADGHFQTQQVLDPGANSFAITAKRFLGGTSQIDRTIFFNATSSATLPDVQPHATSSSHGTSQSSATSSVTSSSTPSH